MTPAIAPPETKTKVVRLKTNLNNKLNNPRFCHIQIAGLNGIPESVAENTIFKFTTDDSSHLPVYAKLIDSVRQPLSELSSVFTWMSHNMDQQEFINKVLKEVPGTTRETEMVIYFYKKNDC